MLGFISYIYITNELIKISHMKQSNTTFAEVAVIVFITLFIISFIALALIQSQVNPIIVTAVVTVFVLTPVVALIDAEQSQIKTN